MVMGPSLLLDKSTFQGLSFECSLHLSRHYRHIVSPILLRELVSDLAKTKRGVEDAELKRVVSELAAKTQTSQSSVLPDALNMACNELLAGLAIPMNGRTVSRENGVVVDVPGLGRGVCFNEHPMMATLRDWSEGDFSEEDLQKATAIRDEDSSVDLVGMYQELEKETNVPQFQSLEEMVGWAEYVHFLLTTHRQQVLRIARHVFQNQPSPIGKVMLRWRRMGCPPPQHFAPYAFYYYRVEVIHFLSLLCGFVRRSKKGKAHLDVHYLYYLPFCNVFSSGDDDLAQLVPFFLRQDQVFISKTDFQQDLKKIASFFSSLSKEEASTFYDEYGFYPPDLEGSFTARMWKQFMRPRRPREGEVSRPSPEESEKIMKEFRVIQEAIEQQQRKQSKE